MAIKIAGVDVINDDRELVLAKLTDINSTISSTASDVFVYDTSKDSDGGAWRHRTQHTSWYNEGASSTRGSRKEFPAVAVIVVEANGPVVTIYDGDDPSLPMWMVANVRGQDTTNYGFTAIGGQSGYLDSTAALNGKLCFGGSGGYQTQGVLVWDFPADTFGNYASNSVYSGITAGTLADRNTIQLVTQSLPKIVLSIVNDVAMTVLPDAPTDPATGLAVPTTAIATDGGVSVITDSGDVYDSSSTSAKSNMSFDGNRLLYTQKTSEGRWSIDVSTIAADGFAPELYDEVTNNGWYPTDDAPVGTAVSGSQLLSGSNRGLYIHDENPTTPANGMVAYVTSSYNSGYQNGDIKLAALADTTAETLSGSELVPDLSTYADQTAFDVDWTRGTGWTFDATNDAVNCDGTQTGNSGLQWEGYSNVTEGELYQVNFTISNYVAGFVNPHLRGVPSGNVSGNGQKVSYIVAGNGTSYGLNLFADQSFDATISNVSIRLADPDRSVNGNGLAVHGSITKAAVATGADVVGYSGFSSSNYLEQPYNSDLDFGTGDFCVMGWVTYKSGANNFIIDRTNGAASSTDRWNFGINASGLFQRCDSTSITISHTFVDGVRYFICGVRTGGVFYAYVDGALVGSAAQAGDQTDASQSYPLTVASFGGSNKGEAPTDIALFRISATAPTADQIKYIYDSERPLFQENAAATLYGSSDAVTALAHDPVTDLLHVGTSAGRSVFQGLRRVDNTTTAVSTAISANDSLIVEQ